MDDWLIEKTPEDAAETQTPDWLIERAPDTQAPTQAFDPISKQQKVQETVAELRAKNMDTIKAQKAFSLSREEGLPMDVAYRQADQFVKSRKPGEIAALRPDAPAAARHLSEGDNLSLYTEDDVKKLGTWEKLSLQWEKTGRESEESIELSDLGYKMRSGEATKQDEARYYELKQLQASRSDFEDDGWAPFTMSAIHSAINFTTTAAARSLTAGAQGAAAGAVTFGGIGATAGTVAVPGAGTVAGGAAGAAAGGVFGGTVAFGGEMMRQTFQLVAGQAYLAAKESLDENGDPLSDEAAWNVSTVTGLIGGAFEVLGLKMFSKAVAPSINRMMSRNGVKEFVGKMNQNPVLKSRVANLAKTLAAGGAAEATQEVAEQTAQIVSIMTSGGEFDADGNLTSDQLSLDNLALQALGGFIGGVAMSGGLKAGAKGIETTVNFARNRATARRDTLVQQGDAVRGMTAAKNAPAALAEYAQGLEKDNPSQASAPAEALQTLFQSAGLTEEQVQQQFPDLTQSLRDAAETGVEVPLSQETMVKIQTLDAKEAYDEFANDVRLGPDEMTAREAAAEDGTLDEMIANMPEEQKEEAVVASLVEEIVKQQVAEGGMDARTARASATALIKGRVTMMKRAGFTIDEIAAKTAIENKVDPKYQVQVGGGFDVGPNAMQQNDIENMSNEERVDALISEIVPFADQRGVDMALQQVPNGAIGDVELTDMFARVTGEGRAADEVTRLEQNPIFYSALLRGVEASKQPKAGAQQWIGMLKNMPGLKQEELDWLGVEDWLKSQDGPVTREQLAEYIRANSALEDGTIPFDTLSDERLNQAVALKPLVDGAGLGSEELRNILESVSLLSESDRLGSIPSLAPMFSEVRRAAAEKTEVLDAIVGSVPVDVVNNLFGSEAAAKVALHDEAMLKDSAAFNAELPVAGGLGDTASAVRLLLVEVALAAAEVGSVSLGSGGEAGKQVTAVFTGQGYAFRQGTSPDGLMQGSENAGPRAFIEFTKARDIFKITLTGNANLSSFLHETGHYFLELMTDLVESGQANIQMQQDLQMLRDWAGVGEDGKFTVEQHEKFARGFERYLMEGNAPSTGLRALFNRFKGWLTFIYKSMNNLNVDLTDEVRGVMDRMMASDEEIAKAKRNTGRQNDPMDQEIMGLTDAEYEQYIRMWEASEEAERTKVDARLMKDYLTGQKEAFKNEVSRVTAEMIEQIEKTKAYQVWDELRNREVKIERDSIPADLRQLAFGLWVKDGSGLPMDVMAESMGYDNGKQMLQDIATMRAQLKAVPETAKKTVEEAHGFIDPNEFKRVAEAAIHQKEHEEVTLAEYMALTARDGKKVRKGFAAWLNQNAKARVGQMTAQQIKPDHWRRAELKAAQEAAVAVSQKDVTKAALAKRRQMMASAMNRASLEALERVDTIRNEMMRFNKKTRQKALGKAGEAFQNGVNGILELVSFKATTIKAREAAQAVQKMMDEFGPNSVAQIPPEVEALLGKTHYKDMTIDELEALYDTVTTIYTQARELNKLKSEQREVDFQDWLKEVDKKTRESMGEVRQTARSGRGARDALVDGLRWSRAQIVKTEFLTGWMDGSISGGPAKEMLFDPIAKAEADEWDMKKRVYKPIIDRLRSMPKEQRQRLAQKVDFMGNGWNNGAQGTGMNILMAALNMGNAGNLEKLTLGYGWNEEQLRSEVNTFMTKQDWDLVQDILDTVNSLWPDLEREAFKATGIKPPKVEAVPIETPYGEYRGGYFPVAYDLDHIDNKIQMSKITEDGTFVQNFFAPSVSNGMTQKRTKVVSPIRLEPDVLTNHLRDTIHYITHFEAVDQVDKILRRQEFRKLIYETSGEAYYKELRRWLKDVANGSYYTQGEPQLGEKWLHHLRTGTSLAFLGFGIGTMAKQQLGIFTSLQEVKPGYLASGMLQTYNPVTGLRNIKSALAESSELERLIDEWDRDFGKAIDDIGRKLDSTLWDKIRVYAMRGIAMSQLLVNVSTYIGAKNQRLDLGDTPADAQRYAEAAVRMTQSAAGMKDMSPVQRANEATRMITPFFSFAAVFYNRLETIGREQGSIRDVPKTFGKILTLIIAPAVATVLIDELISSFGEGDEKDEKSLEEKLTLEIVGYTLMGFPIIRDVLSFSFRPSLSPYGQAYEQFQAVPQGAYELATEGEIRRSTAKKAVTGLSIITKVPAHQPYGYVDDYFGEELFDK
jgi:hypothetical protein